MPITTNLDKVRLRIGDTDSSDPLLTDDEVNSFIDANYYVLDGGTIYDLAAAASQSARAIAAKFARGYNFSADGQSFNRSERVAHYLQLADELGEHSSQVVEVKSSVATAHEDALSLGE